MTGYGCSDPSISIIIFTINRENKPMVARGKGVRGMHKMGEGEERYRLPLME